MAVLVYLTVGGNDASVSRETLRGLFWPESPESRARRALNQTLYVMRTLLGDGVIEPRGEWDVLINASGLHCDALAFARAVRASAMDDALGLYAGDFLPGFSISGALEFERWVESTRGRLRLEAARAAAGLFASARAMGALGDAIGWARRRLELTPTDELALRDLLTVLAEAGDRGQAVAVYRQFAKHLAADLETAPSPQTQNLVRAIVNDVDPRIGRLPATLLDTAASPQTMPSAARANGARHRRPWLTATIAASLLGALLLARAVLGDRDGSRQAAAQLSRVGRFFWNRRTDASLRTAKDYFARAVVVDPKYAPALSGLADSYTLLAWYGNSAAPANTAAARTAALAAVRLGDDLPEAHTSLGAVRAWLDRDWLAAVSEYRRAIALDSSYATAHQWYALGLAANGRLEDAVREMRAAEHYDPVSPSIATDLAAVLFWSGRDSEAISAVRHALRLDSTYARAWSQLWRLHTAAGRSADAMAALERMIIDRGGSKGDVTALRGAYGRRGSRGALEWWLRTLERSAQTPDRAIRIAVLYALLDQNDAALRWLREAREERTPFLQLAGFDPAFRGLHDDPEFERIVSVR